VIIGILHVLRRGGKTEYVPHEKKGANKGVFWLNGGRSLAVRVRIEKNRRTSRRTAKEEKRGGRRKARVLSLGGAHEEKKKKIRKSVFFGS